MVCCQYEATFTPAPQRGGVSVEPTGNLSLNPNSFSPTAPVFITERKDAKAEQRRRKTNQSRKLYVTDLHQNQSKYVTISAETLQPHKLLFNRITQSSYLHQGPKVSDFTNINPDCNHNCIKYVRPV